MNGILATGIPAAAKHETMESDTEKGNTGHTYRATWKDYSEPTIYLLTMNTHDRQPLLGELVGEKIALSPYGVVVAEEIKRIPTYKDASAIQIYQYVVMPNHIHVLLRVHKHLPHPLGYYISWFKLQCMERCSAIDGIPSAGHEKRPIFGKEYHDRILSRKGQLAHMARYIKDNPRRLALKRANPDLFRIHQQTPISGVMCTTLGNMFLAEHPMREALHCSRSLTQAEIDSLKGKCLSNAANGTIYISPAISEGDKQICLALREAGYPLIIILSEGFPEPDSPHYRFYKPSGVYFEACAAGQLLLIEPDAALFERKDIEEKVYTKTGIRDLPHNAKRYRFVAQNAIADLIAEESSRE